jgi:AcrR family transcriptional regulator
MQPDARREALLAAAAGVIARRGFARTRVADIAAAAGVSTGLLHRYHPTLDDALAAAFAHVAERELAGLARLGDLPPRERLRAVVDGSTHPQDWMRIWVDAWGESLHRPALRETAARYTETWRAMLAALIADGVAAGDWTCPDPAGAAARLVAGLDGLALHAVVHPLPGGTAAAEDAAWRLLAAELGVPAARLRAPSRRPRGPRTAHAEGEP